MFKININNINNINTRTTPPCCIVSIVKFERVIDGWAVSKHLFKVTIGTLKQHRWALFQSLIVAIERVSPSRASTKYVIYLI